MASITQEAATIFDGLLPQNQEYLLTLTRVAATAEQGARRQMEQQPPEQPPASA